MDPPRKRQRHRGHDTDGSSRQDEVPHPQHGGNHQANTFGGVGIQSTGNFNVTGNLHINVNNSTKERAEEIKQEKKDKEADRKRLLMSLEFAQMHAREFSIKRAHASTCQWMLTNDQYDLWARRRHMNSDRFIWLKGKPGTGKSTMMKFLLGHLQRQLVLPGGNENEILISFFFNARGAGSEKTTLGLYRSLLLQLLQKRPEVQTVLDDLQPNHEWTVDSLEWIFEQTVARLTGVSVTCLIDALDECEESQARNMVHFLRELTQINNDLHICFASRHYPHINIATKLEIVLEHQPEHQKDIKRYLSSRLQIGHDPLMDQIRSDILIKSCGIFMWVVLVVDILNRECDAGRKHSLRECLEQLPEDLHRLFHNLLTRDTKNVEGLLLCIQWLLFARRPLTPKELYFAIISGLTPKYLQTCHMEHISEDDIRKYILDTSKGLAEPTGTHTDTVQFIHESVVDFLIKDKGLATIFSDLGDEIHGKSHNKLKCCCLQYIDFAQPLSQSRTEDDFPFISYALKEFAFHADQAEAGGIDQKDFMASLSLGKWFSHELLASAIEQDADNDGRIWPQRGDLKKDSEEDLGKEDIYLPSPLYFLAQKGTASLIRAHRADRSCFTLEKSEYAMPIMAAAAADMTDTVLALLEMELERHPAHSSQDLCGQVLHLKREDIKRAKMSAHKFEGNEENKFCHLAKFAPELVTIVFLQMFEVNANAIDLNGWSPLFHAMSRDHCILMRHLIDLHADVSHRNKEGKMLIHWAVKDGSVKASTILCESGCDINAQDDDGWTPMHHVVSEYGPLEYYGHERADTMIKLLLKYGANIDANDETGQTPLHLAVRRYRPIHLLELLLRSGASADAHDQEGRTPLHYAMASFGYGHNDDFNMAECLLSNSADVSAADTEGRTTLRYALWINAGNPTILGRALRMLQKYGADLSAADYEGKTSLHWSLGLGLHDCVEQLLYCGVNISKPDRNQYTPIWWAVYASRPDVRSIQLLINRGANIRDPDGDGYTLLHRAVEQDKVEVVRVLVRNGASTETRNKYGQSPLDLATSLGLADIGGLLLSQQNR